MSAPSGSISDECRIVSIASDALAVDIATLGAEMRNLRDGDGRRLQWDGDPAVWSGQAPLLFPIVGMLVDGRYRLDGRMYAMPKHGFARRSTFELVATSSDAATLRLVANDATRVAYPFEFRLEVAYRIARNTLTVVATIANEGDAPLPASFGFHPAFAWPLPYGASRADHRIEFAHDEAAPIRRIDAAGLLTPTSHPTPVVGRSLTLVDDDFDDDALIFDGLASRSLRYGPPGGPGLVIRFDDFPLLGVWTKPGARFLCIEPWQGVADPEGFDGDFRLKPEVVTIDAGNARRFAMSIELVGVAHA